MLADDRIEQMREEVGQKHSSRVLPMVDALLQSRGLRVQELDGIAFGAGPGSFTGLRIACGVAQGLAFGVGIKVLPVGNLRALAQLAFAMHPSCRRALVAIDARMNEAYFAVYERAQECTELRAPALAKPEQLVELAVSLGCDLVVGDALQKFAAAWPVTCDWQSEPALRADAAAILGVALLDFAAGNALAPDKAAPLYVRNRVALSVEERRAAAAVT